MILYRLRIVNFNWIWIVICSYFARRQSKQLYYCKNMCNFCFDHLSLNAKHADLADQPVGWLKENAKTWSNYALFLYYCAAVVVALAVTVVELNDFCMDDTFHWHRVSCVNFFLIQSLSTVVILWSCFKFSWQICQRGFLFYFFFLFFFYSCLSTHNVIPSTSHRFWSDNLNG